MTFFFVWKYRKVTGLRNLSFAQVFISVTDRTSVVISKAKIFPSELRRTITKLLAFLEKICENSSILVLNTKVANK